MGRKCSEWRKENSGLQRRRPVRAFYMARAERMRETPHNSTVGGRDIARRERPTKAGVAELGKGAGLKTVFTWLDIPCLALRGFESRPPHLHRKLAGRLTCFICRVLHFEANNAMPSIMLGELTFGLLAQTNPSGHCHMRAGILSSASLNQTAYDSGSFMTFSFSSCKPTHFISLVSCGLGLTSPSYLPTRT